LNVRHFESFISNTDATLCGVKDTIPINVAFHSVSALYFQTGFSQEHRGRYDIKESNLMQHKEQQKSNSIFIKKNNAKQTNNILRVARARGT
jgi:hypothetical protein